MQVKNNFYGRKQNIRIKEIRKFLRTKGYACKLEKYAVFNKLIKKDSAIFENSTKESSMSRNLRTKGK